MAPFYETSAEDYPPTDPKKPVSLEESFAPAPAPITEMANYRLLAPSAGVRVSPLCLGAMNLGTQWSGYIGNDLSIEDCYKYLDAFYDAGGNFIDTANNYQAGQNEHIIGQWMKRRNNRDDIVLATKYTTSTRSRPGVQYDGLPVNYAGNAKKSLKLSVEESLRKLHTDYIDILYVHWWDHSTSIPELMQSLNDLVRSGKVLYLGISDTPAWIVSGANEYARAHGFAQFVIYQGNWSLSGRDCERDIIPMCRTYGMAFAPWGVLGGGKYKTPEELKERARLRGGNPPSEADIRASEALMKVAAQVGDNASLTGVALAWARAKVAYCFPIVGGSNPAHLKDNIDALKISLTKEQVATLDAAMPFNPGFPTGFFGTDPHYLPGGKPDSFILNNAAHVKFVEYP